MDLLSREFREKVLIKRLHVMISPSSSTASATDEGANANESDQDDTSDNQNDDYPKRELRAVVFVVAIALSRFIINALANSVSNKISFTVFDGATVWCVVWERSDLQELESECVGGITAVVVGHASVQVREFLLTIRRCDGQITNPFSQIGRASTRIRSAIAVGRTLFGQIRSRTGEAFAAVADGFLGALKAIEYPITSGSFWDAEHRFACAGDAGEARGARNQEATGPISSC